MSPKYYSGRAQAPKRHRARRWLLALLPLVIIAGAAYWLVVRTDPAEAPQGDTSQQTIQSEEPGYTPVNLQPAIEEWVARQDATYHIVVYDPQAKQIIGFNLPEQVLFAASLYKQFVAYLSLVDFQTGAQNPDDILISGQTKRQCVDKMIRESDSPCGEAMMAEIGQSVLNQRVADMGLTGTFFNGIRTSAQDSALILQYIIEKRDLNDENTAFLLDAMRTQEARYKRGLQTGAPEAVWETKVGWNEDTNYHDIGIMTLPDGRKFAVAILGQGSGSPAPIADFATTIYSTLTAD